MDENASNSIPAISLFKGQTLHARFTPFTQSFAYRLFLIDIDIDRLQEADEVSSLFCVDRPGLFSFRRRDHGDRLDTDLRPWAERMFAEANVDLKGGVIRLVTLPRHLFYKFAPISLWFGYHPSGALKGIIYEVNNTFGETHSYVAPASDVRMQHEAAKHLYVSPFFDVSGVYRFTVRPPTEKLDIVVENMDGSTRTHMANIKARKITANSTAFLKAALSRPFSTHGISVGIHWQALKLWLKGAGYRPRPKAHATEATIAQPLAVSTNSKDNP